MLALWGAGQRSHGSDLRTKFQSSLGLGKHQEDRPPCVQVHIESPVPPPRVGQDSLFVPL